MKQLTPIDLLINLKIRVDGLPKTADYDSIRRKFSNYTELAKFDIYAQDIKE